MQSFRMTPHTFPGSGSFRRILSHSGETAGEPNSPRRNRRNAAFHASAASPSGSTSNSGSTPASAGKERRTRAQKEWKVVTDSRPTASTISSTRRRSDPGASYPSAGIRTMGFHARIPSSIPPGSSPPCAAA